MSSALAFGLRVGHLKDWSSAWSLYDYLDAKGEDPDQVGESEQ